ncbi:MAG: hypothetical protein PHY48_08950 [Candidatus Cloacimonetes bacterium]|nr:hypothetical protein [Candidatus Cloacimonadota bacterium]
MNIDNIKDLIRRDCKEEFSILKREILGMSKPDTNIDDLKHIYTDLVVNALAVRIKLLLDTLVNYLMESSLSDLEQQEVVIQNDFFNKDFRKRIANWVLNPLNSIEINPPNIHFSSDPRIKIGYIASSLTLLLCISVALVYKPKNYLILSVATITSIVSTAIAYKVGYKYSEQKARNIIQSDTSGFLSNSEKQVLQWLLRVADYYDNDFREFCTLNKIPKQG